MLFNTIYRLNAISIKIPVAFFRDIEKKTPEIGMEPKGTEIFKTS